MNSTDVYPAVRRPVDPAIAEPSRRAAGTINARAA